LREKKLKRKKEKGENVKKMKKRKIKGKLKTKH
jgi:hypothetical protein